MREKTNCKHAARTHELGVEGRTRVTRNRGNEEEDVVFSSYIVVYRKKEAAMADEEFDGDE